MSSLTHFRINTSKYFRVFCISLISGQLKSSVMNTSAIFDVNLPRINTSTKTGGRGLQLQLATFALLPAGRRRHPEESATRDLSVSPAYLFVGVMSVTGRSQWATRISKRRCSSRLKVSWSGQSCLVMASLLGSWVVAAVEFLKTMVTR